MTFSCLPENILEESISFLRFNTRADNVLKRNGTGGVNITRMDSAFILHREKSQKEIVQKMEKIGLADDSYAAVRNIKLN